MTENKDEYSKFASLDAPFSHWKIASAAHQAKRGNYRLASQGIREHQEQFDRAKRQFVREVVEKIPNACTLGPDEEE